MVSRARRRIILTTCVANASSPRVVGKAGDDMVASETRIMRQRGRPGSPEKTNIPGAFTPVRVFPGRSTSAPLAGQRTTQNTP